mgnify:CR=1 FL=1
MAVTIRVGFVLFLLAHAYDMLCEIHILLVRKHYWRRCRLVLLRHSQILLLLSRLLLLKLDLLQLQLLLQLDSISYCLLSGLGGGCYIADLGALCESARVLLLTTARGGSKWLGSLIHALLCISRLTQLLLRAIIGLIKAFWLRLGHHLAWCHWGFLHGWLLILLIYGLHRLCILFTLTSVFIIRWEIRNGPGKCSCLLLRFA